MLQEIKQRIQQGRLRVVLSANSAMVGLYWETGPVIPLRQGAAGWGAKIIDRLATDLRSAYPEMQGFSPRNLKYMRAFAAAWPDVEIVQRVVAQLPWGQNIALLERFDDTATRLWYAAQTREHGWSATVLRLQIERRAHERHGKAVNNFAATLPQADSDLAAQIFNLSAADDLLRHADDRPAAGLLLCRSKHQVVVEYALRDLGKPIGVAGWETQLAARRPKDLEGSLPTVAQIEAEFGGVDE